MANNTFEPAPQSNQFDLMWQQWLARSRYLETIGVSVTDIGATVQAWDADIDALAALTGTGIAARTGNSTWALRTITGTAGEITLTNGNGVSGNPVISLPTALDFTDKTITAGTFSSPDINTPDIDGGTIDDVTLGGTLAGSPTASGVWTFTGSGSPPRAIKISNAFPNILLIETDATADNQAWEIKANASAFTVTAKDDTLTGGNDAITITRSGVVPDNIDFFVNTITRNGTAVLDRTNTATVTNKSIALSSNTLTGTKALFNTALTDGDFLYTDLIGSTVQAYSANLDEYAAVNPTAAGLALLDDAAASNQRDTLGLGTGDTPDFAGVTLTSTDAGATAAPIFILYRNSASPAISDALGVIRFNGKNSAGDETVYANIRAEILDPDSINETAKVVFRTFDAGTTAERLFIGGGLVMFGATGGDQGTGTINATAVYDDGVILTDYVPDAYIDGDYSVTDYDSRIPIRRLEDGTIVPRQHGPARRFKTNFDELDPVLFANKWKASRKLPAFTRGPEKKSTGECIQALLETCEVLAVHMDKYENRLQALEA